MERGGGGNQVERSSLQCNLLEGPHLDVEIPIAELDSEATRHLVADLHGHDRTTCVE
jgi:hypothetical protein